MAWLFATVASTFIFHVRADKWVAAANTSCDTMCANVGGVCRQSETQGIDTEEKMRFVTSLSSLGIRVQCNKFMSGHSDAPYRAHWDFACRYNPANAVSDPCPTAPADPGGDKICCCGGVDDPSGLECGFSFLTTTTTKTTRTTSTITSSTSTTTTTTMTVLDDFDFAVQPSMAMLPITVVALFIG